MKHCPVCQRKYSDETLNFCLEDGEWLLNVPSGSEATTAILEPGKVPIEASARQQIRATDETAILPGGAVDEKRGSGTPIDRKMLRAAGIVLFLVGAGVLGYRYFGPSPYEQIYSIAVLPFENESGNSDIEYLSDGMTESMINSLSRLPNLSVKARSSVFRYKGKGAEPTAVGKDLNVQAVLNGRVIQRGGEVTISLELVNVGTGDHIWGDQYNRKLGDLAALQSEIARDVSQNLRLRLTGEQSQVVN